MAILVKCVVCGRLDEAVVDSATKFGLLVPEGWRILEREYHKLIPEGAVFCFVHAKQVSSICSTARTVGANAEAAHIDDWLNERATK